MKERIIKTNTVHTRITEWGKTNETIIVFLHGLGSSGLTFIEIANILKDSFYIISIDLPGNGKTQPFTEEEHYSMPNLSNWLNQVITSITNDKVYIVGHSFGAHLALYYSSMYENVNKVILLDGGFYNLKDMHKICADNKLEGVAYSIEEEFNLAEKHIEDTQFTNIEMFLEAEKKDYSRYSDMLEIASRDIIREKDNGIVELIISKFTAKSMLLSMYDYPTNDIYSKVRAPVLLINREVPDFMRNMVKGFIEEISSNLDLTSKTVNLSHLLYFDDPTLISNEIRHFIKY